MGLVSVSIWFTYYTICTLSVPIPSFYLRTLESIFYSHEHTKQHGHKQNNTTTIQPSNKHNNYTPFKHSYNVVKINQKLIKKFYKNVLTLYYDFGSMVSDKQGSKQQTVVNKHKRMYNLQGGLRDESFCIFSFYL
jgi:hypothetical protein